MSLAAVRYIINTDDPGKDGRLLSFESKQPATAEVAIRNDTPDVEIYLVRTSADPSRSWDSVAIIDPSTVRYGIGDKDIPPASGSFALIYAGNGTGLDALPFDIWPANLQTALNANPAFAAVGGVTVRLLSVGNYAITFNNTGARPLIAGSAESLFPDCNAFVSYLRVGTSSLACIQAIQLVQRPYVYLAEWEALPSTATATINELRAGADEVKALWQLSIAPVPYAGLMTVTTSDGASSPISVTASDAEFSAALAGAWNVKSGADGSWTLERKEAGAATVTEADVAGLSVYGGVKGTLAYNSGALYERFISEATDNFASALQIRIDAGSSRRGTVLFTKAQLYRDVLSVAGLSPSSWPGGFLLPADALGGIAVASPSLVTGPGKFFVGTGSVVVWDAAANSGAGAKLTLGGTYDF